MSGATRSQEFFNKVVDETLEVFGVVLKVNKEKRGGTFRIEDARPVLDAVNKMKPVDGQSEQVLALHRDSVNAHYKILKQLTEQIRPEDDPYIEHYQTPAILEILYDEDPTFKESVEKFVMNLEKHEALVGQYVVRMYGGFWGPTCVADFAFVPGSTSNLVNQILKMSEIPDDHKKAILASKSWGMNGSYYVGGAFRRSLEAGMSVSDAMKSEIEWSKKVYLTPSETEAELMERLGHRPFDVKKYMNMYKDAIRPTIRKAIDAQVHYGNIVVVPAYCVGDIGHHISQSSYNMFKDDVTFAEAEAVHQVLDSTLRKALKAGTIRNEWKLLSASTGALAAAVEYMLELDGFTAPMIIDLLYKRFWSYNNKYPNRSIAAECHNVDFMDMISRGWRILWDTYPQRSQPKVSGVEIDLSPIDKHEVINNARRYSYPGCAITVRTSSLLRLADFPCFLTAETVTAVLSTNAIAFNPQMIFSPARVRKHCATTMMMPSRCKDCQWYKAV